MKENIAIIITVIVALTLSVLGFFLGGFHLSELQLETLIILIIICVISMAYCFIAGEITRNNSQVDKLWSILPIIYAWIIVARSQMNLRLIVMAVLITIWGVRLTLNFAKKGAYSIKFWSGEEDYRWIVLRENPKLNNRLKWAFFDLFFISIYQNALVLAITLPLLATMESTELFNVYDALIAVILLGFIILESIADKQQMTFQTKKYELLKQGKKLEDLPDPYNKGFSTHGVWAYSRHPNYLSEQSIWVVLYFFCVSAGVTDYGIFNWTLIGSMFLILLFTGSSKFSENISLQKYPEYQNYINTVSKYVPLRKYKNYL
jgi:steroid 5-alpha reductase family enzyme